MAKSGGRPVREQASTGKFPIENSLFNLSVIERESGPTIKQLQSNSITNLSLLGIELEHKMGTGVLRSDRFYLLQKREDESELAL